jgi:hypothetical protein
MIWNDGHEFLQGVKTKTLNGRLIVGRGFIQPFRSEFPIFQPADS